MVDDPGLFRRLAVEEKQRLNQRFWAEGRLKLEPCLKPRIDHDTITPWPTSQVVSCRQLSQGAIEVTLDVGERLTVDYIVLATGYKLGCLKGLPPEFNALHDGYCMLATMST